MLALLVVIVLVLLAILLTAGSVAVLCYLIGLALGMIKVQLRQP